MAKSGKKVSRKRVEKKNIAKGVAHIQATFNNTIVTICDPAGNVVSWSTAGAKGFKGSRRVPHLRLRWLLKKLRPRRWSMACARLRPVSRVQVPVVSRRCVRSLPPVSPSP